MMNNTIKTLPLLLLLAFAGCATTPDAAPSRSFPGFNDLSDAIQSPGDPREAYKSWRKDHPLPLENETDTLALLWDDYSGSETPSAMIIRLESGEEFPMKHYQGTKLLTARFPKPEGDFGYRFEITYESQVRVVQDPYNPYQDWENDGYSRLIRPGSEKSTVFYAPKVPSKNPFKALNPRSVLVWLPPGYFAHPEKDYPVIYMHDGQQVLDSDKAAFGGWKMDTTAGRLAKEGKIEAPIIVGVFNSSQRDDELMGWSPYHQKDRSGNGGQSAESTLATAKAYDYYFSTEVRAWAESQFRIRKGRESTAVGGASSGAMEALYQIFVHPDIYSKAAALSGGMEYYKDLRDLYFPGRTDLNIYLDCGGQGIDGSLIHETREMKKFLEKKGFKPEKGFDYREFPEDNHNERAWARRSETFLLQFFSLEKK